MIKTRTLLTLAILTLFAPLTAHSATNWRIIGGRPVNANELYGTVAIAWANGDLQCTGTLIAPRVVLSAAHCFVNEDVEPMAGYKASEFQVYVNSIDSTQVKPEDRIAITKIVFNKGYLEPGEELDETSLGKIDDIAVLVLEKAVTAIKPVPILPLNLLTQALVKGKDYVIAGYGIQDLEGNADNKMHIATIPFERNSDWEILLGNTTSTDTCNGDSGGPAYVVLDGKLYVAGVTSRAVSNATKPCGEGGIYTLATKYLDWIKQNADNQFQESSAPNATTPTNSNAPVTSPSTTTPPSSGTTAPSAGTTGTTPAPVTTTTPSVNPGTTPNNGSPTTTQGVANKKSGGCSVTNGTGAQSANGLALLFTVLVFGLRLRRRNQGL